MTKVITEMADFVQNSRLIRRGKILAALSGYAIFLQARAACVFPLIILFLLLCPPQISATPDSSSLGHVNLGQVNFANSCSSAVQSDFNHALALLYSFEYDEAVVGFHAALQKDPHCSIAEWGVALARLQRLSAESSKETLQAGWKELEPVLDHPFGTKRERGYLDAVADLYRDFDHASAGVRGGRYQRAMRQLHVSYPADDNAALYYAMSLNLGASGSVGLANRRRALKILFPVFKRHPNHPGAAHFIIHVCDTPELAPLGLKAALKYASIAPASPHALHMPSHIFSRLGMWNDSIQSNLKSADVAHQWLLQGRKGAYFDEQHARNHLEYAYLQTGQDAKALEQIRICENLQHIPGVNDPWAIVDGRIYYDLELRDWKDAQTIEAPAGASFKESFDIYWIKTIAAARLGEAQTAATNLEKFKQSVKAYGQSAAFYVEITHLDELQAQAWVLHAEHQDKAATAMLHTALEFERAHPIYYPDVLTRPSAESLGDLHMDLHRPKQALHDYEIALTMAPNRIDSLLGAFQSARALYDDRAARRYGSKLLAVCEKNSDRPEISQVSAWMKSKRSASNVAKAMEKSD